MTTKVIFRVDERDGGYEVIAVFPEIAGDMNPRRTCQGYAHIGQHSAISTDYAQWTRPAKPSECQGLFNELVSIGYTDLKPVKRASKAYIRKREEQTR